MAIFFGMELRRHENSLMLNDREILRIDKSIEGESFVGYHKDLTIDYMFPFVKRSQSDDVYLILPKYYYDNFDRDRLVVPDNQFVKCWDVQYHHVMPGGWFGDLYILLARRNDMFCSVRPHGYVLYVVLSDQVLVRKSIVSTALPGCVAGIREFQESGQAVYLYGQNFGNQKWRDVSQYFEPR